MNALICYDSKYGSTFEVCRYIGSGMEKINTDITNVSQVNSFDYDIIVIGSPIFIGKPMKSIEEFIIKNHGNLKNKNIAIFVTCWAMATEYGSSSIEFLEQLKKHLPVCNLVCARALPGKLLLDKISEKDQRIMKRLLRRLNTMSEEFDSEKIAWRDARDKRVAENFGREIASILNETFSFKK